MNRETGLAIICDNAYSEKIRELFIDNREVNLVVVSNDVKDITSELEMRLRDMPKLFDDKIDNPRPIPKYKRKRRK